jgi:hypothetical protein
VTDAGTKCAGTVQLAAFSMGGKVGEQLVTDFTWACVGKPTWGGDTTTLAAGGGKKGAVA